MEDKIISHEPKESRYTREAHGFYVADTNKILRLLYAYENQGKIRNNLDEPPFPVRYGPLPSTGWNADSYAFIGFSSDKNAPVLIDKYNNAICLYETPTAAALLKLYKVPLDRYTRPVSMTAYDMAENIGELVEELPVNSTGILENKVDCLSTVLDILWRTAGDLELTDLDTAPLLAAAETVANAIDNHPDNA